MKRKSHTQEQIIKIQEEVEAGQSTADIVRKHGISEQTFYCWESMFGGDGKGPLWLQPAARGSSIDPRPQFRKEIAGTIIDHLIGRLQRLAHAGGEVFVWGSAK